MKNVAAALVVLVMAACRPADEAQVAQGTVRAIGAVQVRASLAGEVKEIDADFKTPVKSGQVLARIDALAYEQRVSQARADVEAARAARAVALLRQREALLQQAEIDLERTVIRAPVDGTVILRNAAVGETLAAGAPAFTIAPDLRTVRVEVALDQAQAARLRVGTMLRFSVDALPRREFAGEIRELRKASLIVSAPNPDLALLPGMTANVRMPRAP